MSQITNHYAEGSCTFQAGSSQNGDVHITGGTFHQGAAQPSDPADSLAAVVSDSPLCLADQKGTIIDFIRVMNALFETGRVRGKGGGEVSKQTYFTLLGQLFNTDLSNYSKNLSNSMSSATSNEKQTRIFDELKAKHMEIFNSK